MVPLAWSVCVAAVRALQWVFSWSQRESIGRPSGYCAYNLTDVWDALQSAGLKDHRQLLYALALCGDDLDPARRLGGVLIATAVKELAALAPTEVCACVCVVCTRHDYVVARRLAPQQPALGNHPPPHTHT
jgi:hypothetical protein